MTFSLDRRAARRKGFVYFVAPEACLDRPEGDEGRVVKIGFTANDPIARLAGLQTGSPMPLKLWAFVGGDLALEAALHSAFAPLNSHGEWFYAEGALRDLMCRMGGEPLASHGSRLVPTDLILASIRREGVCW